MLHLCSSEGLSSMKDYLLKNWSSPTRFCLWGRRNLTRGIPTSKTTMIVEGHWSVLKRRYLLLHNRPRIDLVLFIISQQLIPRLTMDFDSLLSGLTKPSWWVRFTSIWKKMASSEILGGYKTDRVAWTCSCPGFIGNEFMLCKHLICGSNVPAYKNLSRLSFPPFLSLQTESGRPFPNIMNERSSCRELNGDGGIVNDGTELIIPSPNIATVDIYNEKEEMLSLLDWTKHHINKTLVPSEQEKQLIHLRKVLTTLKRYRDNVQKDEGGNHLPRTWACPDALFLK